jgi:multidrug resistance protein, MATE family
MNFIGFYVLGMPIGLALMLKTSLKVFGFWIGIIIGSGTLVIMQILFTTRINWKKESESVQEKALQVI